MSRKLDLSKPLSEADIKRLRARYPLQYVNHMVARANGGEFDSAQSDDQEPQGMQDGDDPGDFTVDEVVAYLSQPDLSDEERDRVLEVEADGQARVGILGKRD